MDGEVYCKWKPIVTIKLYSAQNQPASTANVKSRFKCSGVKFWIEPRKGKDDLRGSQAWSWDKWAGDNSAIEGDLV